MATAKRRPMATGKATGKVNPILMVKVVTFGPAGRSPAVDLAKKDANARRFYNKSYTSAGDLLGAVSFWLFCGFPRNSLEDFLTAIVPESGWADTEVFDPSKPMRRYRAWYDGDFINLMAGDWGKWEQTASR